MSVAAALFLLRARTSRTQGPASVCLGVSRCRFDARIDPQLPTRRENCGPCLSSPYHSIWPSLWRLRVMSPPAPSSGMPPVPPAFGGKRIPGGHFGLDVWAHLKPTPEANCGIAFQTNPKSPLEAWCRPVPQGARAQDGQRAPDAHATHTKHARKHKPQNFSGGADPGPP